MRKQSERYFWERWWGTFGSSDERLLRTRWDTFENSGGALLKLLVKHFSKAPVGVGRLGEELWEGTFGNFGEVLLGTLVRYFWELWWGTFENFGETLLGTLVRHFWLLLGEVLLETLVRYIWEASRGTLGTFGNFGEVHLGGLMRYFGEHWWGTFENSVRQFRENWCKILLSHLWNLWWFLLGILGKLFSILVSTKRVVAKIGSDNGAKFDIWKNRTLNFRTSFCICLRFKLFTSTITDATMKVSTKTKSQILYESSWWSVSQIPSKTMTSVQTSAIQIPVVNKSALKLQI